MRKFSRSSVDVSASKSVALKQSNFLSSYKRFTWTKLFNSQVALTLYKRFNPSLPFLFFTKGFNPSNFV